MLASSVCKACHTSTGVSVSFPANASSNNTELPSCSDPAPVSTPAGRPASRLTVSPRPHELVQHRSHLCLGRHGSERRRYRCVSHSSPPTVLTHAASWLQASLAPLRTADNFCHREGKSPTPAQPASRSCVPPVQLAGYCGTLTAAKCDFVTVDGFGSVEQRLFENWSPEVVSCVALRERWLNVDRAVG